MNGKNIEDHYSDWIIKETKTVRYERFVQMSQIFACSRQDWCRFRKPTGTHVYERVRPGALLATFPHLKGEQDMVVGFHGGNLVCITNPNCVLVLVSDHLTSLFLTDKEESDYRQLQEEHRSPK